jgi:hypothetical protein
MINQSLQQPNICQSQPFFGMKRLKENSADPDSSSEEVISLLSMLKEESDELERLLDSRAPTIEWEKRNINSRKILESLRKIVQKDSNSMRDDESEIVNSFFQQDGIATLLPFLKFEYFDKILLEAMCLLANLSQFTHKHKTMQLKSNNSFKAMLLDCLPDLCKKFVNPGELDSDHRSYLIMIEHVCVCLIYTFHNDPNTIVESLKYIEDFGFISQLVRYKRESLSIITWLLINIIITNWPEFIPDFLSAGMVGDLIYGVKNNVRVASEVMNILSAISIIKTTVQESTSTKQWNEIADQWIYKLINDERIGKLISDSMKLRHITVIKPLLDLLGNLMSTTDWGIEDQLIKLPHFSEMLDFWFNSRSTVLQGHAFWVIGNMLYSDNPKIVEYFTANVDILNVIMSEFTDHLDIAVQREALYVMFNYLSKRGHSSISLFKNKYSVEKIMAIFGNTRLLPETIMVAFSIIDLICETEHDLIPLFIQYNIQDLIYSISDEYKSNVDITRFWDELMVKYFSSASHHQEKELFGSLNWNEHMEF